MEEEECVVTYEDVLEFIKARNMLDTVKQVEKDILAQKFYHCAKLTFAAERAKAWEVERIWV